MQTDHSEETSCHQNSNSANDTSRSRIALVVPKPLVKTVKNALEAHGNFDKNVKIRPAKPEEQSLCCSGSSRSFRPDAFLVTTKLSVGIERIEPDTLLGELDLLMPLRQSGCEADIGIIAFKQVDDNNGCFGFQRPCQSDTSSHGASTSETISMNPITRTIVHWLQQLPQIVSQRPFARDLVSSYNSTYMIYPPLLLLPPTALSNLSSVFMSTGQSLPEDISSLFVLLSKQFKTSHIALNAPIPASHSKEATMKEGEHLKANDLRSPTGFTPLYGDFGPALSPYHTPSTKDFSSAFWCTAQQNGISQTWAPRYTMFSRGNITEKTRILKLETLTAKRLGSRPEETSAVDLFAGIGYFAFSYAKAGVGKVLCWEINPWSVEGLRRGAKRNRWGAEVIKNDAASKETVNVEERFIVFQESNEHAARRVNSIRARIPPVRHVNCGLLPSSEASWEVAVQVLDPTGGWIHVHENIAKKNIEIRIEEVVHILKGLVVKHSVSETEEHWKAGCDHVEQVKSYAPGVVHYVLDISIWPSG